LQTLQFDWLLANYSKVWAIGIPGQLLAFGNATLKMPENIIPDHAL
jgi:hypothetical protein